MGTSVVAARKDGLLVPMASALLMCRGRLGRSGTVPLGAAKVRVVGVRPFGSARCLVVGGT